MTMIRFRFRHNDEPIDDNLEVIAIRIDDTNFELLSDYQIAFHDHPVLKDAINCPVLKLQFFDNDQIRIKTFEMFQAAKTNVIDLVVPPSKPPKQVVPDVEDVISAVMARLSMPSAESASKVVERVMKQQSMSSTYESDRWSWLSSHLAFESQEKQAQLEQFIAERQEIWNEPETDDWEVSVLHQDFKKLVALMYDVTMPTNQSTSLDLQSGTLVHMSDPLCCGIKPDFVLQGEGHSENATVGCIVMIEITRHCPLTDSEHLARLIQSYNPTLLKESPRRSGVISVLTNLIDIVFVMSERDEKSPDVIKSFISKSFKVLPGLLGLKILFDDKSINLFHNPMYNLDAGRVVASRLLGSGISGDVYRGILTNNKRETIDVAVKIFMPTRDDDFEQELKVWKFIESRVKVDNSLATDRLCKVVGFCETDLVIVYTPVMISNSSSATSSPWHSLSHGHNSPVIFGGGCVTWIVPEFERWLIFGTYPVSL